MRYGHLPLLFIACVSGASCAPSAAQQAAEAQAAFDSHEFEKARTLLAEGLNGHPDDPALLEILARTRLKMGDGDGAIGALDRLKSSSSLPIDAPVMFAEAELLRGKAGAARDRLQGQTSAEAWRLRAWAARLEGEDQQAQQAFATGMAASGQKAPLLADYAALLLDYRRLPEARRLANLALGENPHLLQGHLVTGRIAQAEGRGEDATRSFTKVLEREPKNAAALKGLVQILGNSGKLDAMRPYTEAGYKAYPADADFIFFTAKLAALDKDWPRALAVLQAGEGAITSYPAAQAVYGEALLEQGQAEAAVQRLTVLHAQRPADKAVRRILARALEQTGEWREVASVLQPLIQSGSARPEDLALFRRAMGEAAKT